MRNLVLSLSRIHPHSLVGLLIEELGVACQAIVTKLFRLVVELCAMSAQTHSRHYSVVFVFFLLPPLFFLCQVAWEAPVTQTCPLWKPPVWSVLFTWRQTCFESGSYRKQCGLLWRISYREHKAGEVMKKILWSKCLSDCWANFVLAKKKKKQKHRILIKSGTESNILFRSL